ncbi:MAG: hypothetical protein HFJ33_04950 [Clostridia bacterium]|nr:hypothetical protein [Clostridia bacterium]
MTNKKGITLITLVVTIVILTILASVATYSGISVIQTSKLTAFTTELKIMQTQVNELYEKEKNAQIGNEITGNIQIEANKIFAELAKDSKTGIISIDGYRYWSKDIIKQLGIDGVDQDFFVNLAKRSVVSYQGIEYEGKRYYTLSQLPNGLYNVEHQKPIADKPTFDVEVEKIGLNKWRVTITNINYTGYISKWEVQHQIQNRENWNTTEEMSFVLNQAGTYKIKIANNEIESEEKEFILSE